MRVVPRWCVVLLAALVLGALTASLSGIAGATPSSATRDVRKTWKLPWPAEGQRNTFTLRMRQANATIKDVRVFIGKVEIVPDGYDNIVACAHRGPSFAAATWSVPKPYAIRVRVSLESGPCFGGPKTAGTLATVTVAVVYAP